MPPRRNGNLVVKGGAELVYHQEVLRLPVLHGKLKKVKIESNLGERNFVMEQGDVEIESFIGDGIREEERV
jgi:hypothetical protein